MNGKRHGKGKDFYIKKVLFEGTYKNGMKWDGIGFDSNNNIICEFNNGKGFIKKYTGWHDDILEFEDEFYYGEGNRKVKEYDKEGRLKFEGEY